MGEHVHKGDGPLCDPTDALIQTAVDALQRGERVSFVGCGAAVAILDPCPNHGVDIIGAGTRPLSWEEQNGLKRWMAKNVPRICRAWKAKYPALRS